MSKNSNSRKPTTVEINGPIQPGSPLYRALEMIAQEIVKELAAEPTVTKKSLQRQ